MLSRVGADRTAAALASRVRAATSDDPVGLKHAQRGRLYGELRTTADNTQLPQGMQMSVKTGVTVDQLTGLTAAGLPPRIELVRAKMGAGLDPTYFKQPDGGAGKVDEDVELLRRGMEMARMQPGGGRPFEYLANRELGAVYGPNGVTNGTDQYVPGTVAEPPMPHLVLDNDRGMTEKMQLYNEAMSRRAHADAEMEADQKALIDFALRNPCTGFQLEQIAHQAIEDAAQEEPGVTEALKTQLANGYTTAEAKRAWIEEMDANNAYGEEPDTVPVLGSKASVENPGIQSSTYIQQHQSGIPVVAPTNPSQEEQRQMQGDQLGFGVHTSGPLVGVGNSAAGRWSGRQ